MENLLRELWALRQSTAPDRNMIPEVHTLTSTRLDYESQIENAKVNRNVRKLEKEVSVHRRYMRILFPLLPLLVGAAISITIYRYETKQPVEKSIERIALDRISAFERFSRDPAVPFNAVCHEGERIKKEFLQTNARLRKYVAANIRALVAEARAEYLQNAEKQLSARIAALESEYYKYVLFLLLNEHAARGDFGAVARIAAAERAAHPEHREWIDRREKDYRRMKELMPHRKPKASGTSGTSGTSGAARFSSAERKYYDALGKGGFGAASSFRPSDADLRSFMAIFRKDKLMRLRFIRAVSGADAAKAEMRSILPAFEGGRDYPEVKAAFENAVR